MSDSFLPGLIRESSIALGIARTTETCARARALHNLEITSYVALGRLLTATALCRFIQPRAGQMSIQVVCDGRLRQLFADITEEGALRGYVRNGDLALPLAPEQDMHGRRAIGLGIGSGTVSVIRMDASHSYQQSSVDLVSGEIDLDVQHFFSSSDQIPTVLVCDVVLNADEGVSWAGGLIAQALPHANLDALRALEQQVSHGGFAERFTRHHGKLERVLAELAPKAEVQGRSALQLQWQCRCSDERVVSALGMLGPIDLAEMIDTEEPAHVTCDFCGRRYDVTTDVLTDIYTRKVVASG